MGMSHAITVRVAWRTLGKTKEEVKEIIGKMDDAPMKDLLARIARALWATSRCRLAAAAIVSRRWS